MLVTSKKILNLLEDFGPSSYPIGNITNQSYLSKSDIIKLINTNKGFAEQALIDLLKTDYSYYIIGKFNPFFNRIKDLINSGTSLNKEDYDKLKEVLINDYIDIVIQVVNFNRINKK